MADILVIEDNAINLELMLFLLQAHGHRTRSAVDGEGGLREAQAARPDLIICDIQMPGLDGYEVAARLRADPALRSVPLVAVSAYAMVGDRERSLAAGFDAHFNKPIDPEAFLSSILQYLQPAVRPASPDSGAGVGEIPAALRAPRDGIVLLTVDDLASNLAFKHDLLEPAGYTVIDVGDGETAWQRLQQGPVDLVLSDVVMPGSGGFALLERVRRDPALKDLPFVFLTSTARDAASQARGLALGAQRYLIRPMDPLALLQELRGVLESPRPG